jgi:glucokinase
MTRISIKKKILAGDIGGTNTRLGIFSVGNQRPELEAFKAYSSRDEAGLEQILERFVKDTKSSKRIKKTLQLAAGPADQ